MDWLMHNPTTALEQEALWDAWELVEDHTRDQIQQAYRAGLTARGIFTHPQRAIDLAVTRIVEGTAVAYDADHLAAMAAYRAARAQSGRLPLLRSLLPQHPELRRQARAAVQARAAGLTRDQVRAELAAEYTARGMGDIDPIDLSTDTYRIRPPSARERLAAVGKLVHGARWLIHAVRSAPNVDPDDEEAMRRVTEESRATQEAAERTHNPPAWADPPPTATPLDDRSPLTAVRAQLNPDAPELFARLRAEWTTAHPDALLHPWLTTTGPGSDQQVTVHLGDLLIGHLPPRPGTRLNTDLTAAATTGNVLTTDGLLTGTGASTDPWQLRVTVPREP